MKKISLLFLLCFLTFSLFSQSVDLDREYMEVSYVRLPANPVQDENYRTYSVSVNSSYISRSAYPSSILEDKILLEGFEKVNANGTISIEIQIGDVIINNTEISKREVVKKDKEGNVTSRKTYYTPVVTYTTSGTYFLKDHTENPPSYSLGGKSIHKGSEYGSYSAANKYFSNNRGSLKSKFTRSFIESIPSTVNGKINYRYGYSPMNYKALLWVLDSKKNPEFEGHKKALADIQALFLTMKYDLPIDDIKLKAEPIVTYFESVIPKFSDIKKKKNRKMRYASYFNIAYLYYYLDMPDMVIEYANKLIENDYDKGDGKTLLKKAEQLKKRFTDNENDTRHFAVVTTDNSTQGEYQEDVSGIDSSQEMSKENFLETILTDADNQKVEGTIKIDLPEDVSADEADLTNYITGPVNLMTLSDNDEIIESKYYPKDNVSFKINEMEYAAIKFKSAEEKQATTGSVVDASGAEHVFARVVFKSDKLGLYAYQDELIFKKSSEDIGQSTSSMVWNIGFKKKLSNLVEGCEVLNARINSGGFENNEKSLTIFIKEYASSCP